MHVLKTHVRRMFYEGGVHCSLYQIPDKRGPAQTTLSGINNEVGYAFYLDVFFRWCGECLDPWASCGVCDKKFVAKDCVSLKRL